MREIASIYNINDPKEPIPMDREKFYDKQIEAHSSGAKLHQAIGIFDVFLFSERGEFILQKRSHKKRHNQLLIDKAVGGHIQHNDSPYYTAMIETVQELQVPSVVLRQDEDFVRTFCILKEYLENTAILRLIDGKIHTINNVIDEKEIPILKNVWLFFGIYSGASKPVDREASGVLYYEKEVLFKEMKDKPDLFTPDLHYFIKEYGDKMDEFLEILKKC